MLKASLATQSLAIPSPLSTQGRLDPKKKPLTSGSREPLVGALCLALAYSVETLLAFPLPKYVHSLEEMLLLPPPLTDHQVLVPGTQAKSVTLLP